MADVVNVSQRLVSLSCNCYGNIVRLCHLRGKFSEWKQCFSYNGVYGVLMRMLITDLINGYNRVVGMFYRFKNYRLTIIGKNRRSVKCGDVWAEEMRI
jgi:hypothetical protein